MRTLELPAGKPPREWGRIHGESFRGEVKALAAIRAYLCTRVGGFKTTEQVMVAAKAHLPVLERYHANLHAELVGIAEGAAVTPEEVVIANHYTDLRDLDRMSEPYPEMVAVGCDEDLRLVAEAAEGDRMDNAVAVPLEDIARAARTAVDFLMGPAARSAWLRGEVLVKGHQLLSFSILI